MKRETIVSTVAAVALVGIAIVLTPAVPVSIGTWGWIAFSALLLVGAGASSFNGYRNLSGVFVAGFFLVGFAWWAPFWHALVYGIFVSSPGSLQWLGVGILLTLVFAYAGAKREEKNEQNYGDTFNPYWTLAMASMVFAIAGFLILGPAIGGLYAHDHMADRVEQDATQLDSPPESTAKNSRIAPKAVAENWATNSLQYPRYSLEGGDITYINGTPYWSYALSPDGTYNTLTQQQRGAVYVNQSSMRKDIIVHDEQRFKYGHGVGITDSYDWQVKQEDYWKAYREPFVVPHNGESYIVVPYETHEWEFRLTPIPQLYAMPQFGGVKVIDQDGNIENVPASETEEHPVLDGQNYYPYGLTRFKVESIAYKNGILNTFFGHDEQIELANVPGNGNQQPFTIPTEEGPTYLVAVEPWGNANGVFQIWTVDAQTGDMQYTQFSQQEALRGPRKAVDSIMAAPQLARLNNVEAVEPIPVIKDGTLYWQVRVVPDSNARITYVAFFNADTEEVTVIETTQDVQAFLAADQTVDGVNASQPSSNDVEASSCAFRVIIQYSDGTSKTTCAPDGSTITIEEGGNQSNTGGN